MNEADGIMPTFSIHPYSYVEWMNGQIHTVAV
jgi:hypothetical protein